MTTDQATTARADPVWRIGPSAIQGTGLFAQTRIPRGFRVIEYVGEKITKSEALERCARQNASIFYLDDQFDLDGSGPGNPARFINHSCLPNCDAELIEGRLWIIARRDLEPGEEITFNYGYDLEDLADHPCHCGAPDCVGVIVAAEFFDTVRRRRHAATLGARMPSSARS